MKIVKRPDLFMRWLSSFSSPVWNKKLSILEESILVLGSSREKKTDHYDNMDHMDMAHSTIWLRVQYQ